MAIFRTGLLLAAMTAFFLTVGYLVGGKLGIGIAFVLAAGMNFFAWYSSDKMALRAHRAYPADPVKHRSYIKIVEDLARRADLPQPGIYILPGDQPNAFATGRNPENAAVAATEGLLRLMDEQEVAAVMAHELAHIKNRDTLTMTISATFAGAISMLANFALFFGAGRDRGGMGIIGSLAIMILAPLGASLIQMTISRAREYEADRVGGEICGNPLWLASALGKLEQNSGRARPQTTQDQATAHMFIINPLSGKSMDRLFSTHPNTGNRIAALEEQASDMGIYSRGILRQQRPSAPIDEPTPAEISASQGPWGARTEETQTTPRKSAHLPKSSANKNRKRIW